MVDLKTAARVYFDLGLPVVVLNRKTPLVEWAKWQSIPQTVEEFEKQPWSEADSFAVICGIKANNGLHFCVVDLDVKNLPTEIIEKGKKAVKELPITQTEQTPSGGQHFVYFSYAKPKTISIFHNDCALELLGESKLCILEPSANYRRYNDNSPTIVQDLESMFLAALHKVGVKKSSAASTRKRPRKSEVRFCCEQALRGDNHVKHEMRLCIAAEYKKAGYSDEQIVELFRTQSDFNEDTCLTQIRSADPSRAASCGTIAQYGYCYDECPRNQKTQGVEEIGAEEGRESQADAMVKLAQAESVSLFHDERREPYIRIRKGETLVTMRLRSKETKAWLSSLLWRDREKAPSSEALSSSLNVLEALANDGEEHQLYNRVASGEDGSIWLDLCDEEWRAIHVTRAGWEVVNHPPILFRRYSHQQPIPIPVHGESIAPILDYANIKHLGDQLLYVVAAITNLIPGIPHVVIILFGPQGSGKTWALRTIRLLIDPSQLDLLSLPTRYVELVQNLDHNWCAFYDNIGGNLPFWQSNVFCRAVTGGGVSKRQLYTDDDDIIYQYHRCVGLTDINIAAERGDLLQRSLLLGLEAISKDQRKTENELRAKFAQDQPKILGGMLDVLVKALNLYPTIKLQSLHRMADYTIWGYAITQALGLDPLHFIDAYEENINAQNLEAVRANPISDVLISLMETNQLGWSGTVSQLYSKLEEKAKDLKISTRQKAWPKKPHILSRILNELAPSLPTVGLKADRGYREHTRLIHITTFGSVGSVGELERQADWGKGGDLRNYLGEATAATVASAGSFESLSGNQLETPLLNPPLVDPQPGVSEASSPDKLANIPYKASQASSVREVLEHVRQALENQGFTEYTFESTCEEYGLKHEDAEKLFWSQVDAGQIGRDPEGLWKWVK